MLNSKEILEGWKSTKYVIIKNKDLTALALGTTILKILEEDNEITILNRPETLDLSIKVSFKTLTRVAHSYSPLNLKEVPSQGE